MDFSAHSILWILLIGLIIGAIAKLLMPGKDPGGCIVTMLLGIAGAFVASYLGQAVGWYRPGEPAGFIGSRVGQMVAVFCSAARIADFHSFMPAPTRIRMIVAFAALYLIWGSTFLGIRFAIETIP